MIRVIIESPFAPKGSNDVERALDGQRKQRYLKACIRDCLTHGEAPFASHLMYTGALDDTIPAERDLGIDAGFAWRSAAMKTVVYTDLGISTGMKSGIEHAERLVKFLTNHVIEYRTLGEGWDS